MLRHAILLAPLSLLLAASPVSAGAVESAACAPTFVWGNETVDAIWQATHAYGCTVVGIAAGEVRGAACAPTFVWGNEVVDALWQATHRYGCTVVTILV